jgi:hypothetical protein
MTFKIATALGALAVAAAIALPAAASAQTTMPQTTYTTALTETGPLASPGAYTARMTITLGSDGIVQGWYISDSPSNIEPVKGGTNADGSIWLNIGQNGGLHITAFVRSDGSLSGSGFTSLPATSVMGPTNAPATYDFVAAPVAL